MAEEPRSGELTTANFGWVKPTVGDSDDAWGGMLNADLDGIDSVVHGIQTSIPTVPAASATSPAMDGTAAAGSSAAWSRGDHVHPTDTTLYAASNPSGYQTAANVTATLGPYALTANVPVASSTAPVMDGTAAVGTGTAWARADHVHPTDTTKLPKLGVTDGSDAPPGQIGEYITASQLTNVALTNNAASNVISISLTAGDWDVEGNVQMVFATGVGATVVAAISTVSATLPNVGVSWSGFSRITLQGSGILNTVVLATGMVRLSLSSTTIVYLLAYAGFASSTATAQGTIRARRAR